MSTGPGTGSYLDPKTGVQEMADSLEIGDCAEQLKAYLSAPRGKSIRAIDKLICTMMVAAHCVRVAARSLTSEQARWIAQKWAWRRSFTFGSAPAFIEALV